MASNYLIALFFIIIASLNVLFEKFSKMDLVVSQRFSPTINQLVYTSIIVVLFTIFYMLLATKEGFFFTAPQNPILGRNMARDAAFDTDRQLTFSFDSVGSGMCSDDGCNSYGMIKGCPNAKSYGRGNTDDSVW
jgi:hypothetical protein